MTQSPIAGHKESDTLDGDDPDSASNAMADIMTHSWITSFGRPLFVIASAGNVIGGGEVSLCRLLLDFLNSFASGVVPTLRYPVAVWPWQRALDCLNDDIMISEELIANESISESFNNGPDQNSFVSIGEVANVSVKAWGSDATSTKNELNWHNKLKFQDAIEWIVDWQKRKIQGESAFQISIDQIEKFTSIN